MIKELVKLADFLDQRGLIREASIVDNIIKKTAQHDAENPIDVSKTPNMYPYGRPKSYEKGRVFWPEETDETPKPTLAPIEEPDMDHPVFNSEERKEGGKCEEIKNALLALLGTSGDMDKFYEAAVNLVETIKKLFKGQHPELDYLYYAPRDKVRDAHDFFPTLTPRGLPEYEGKSELKFPLNFLVIFIAESSMLMFKNGMRRLFLDMLGLSKECVKEMHTALVNNCQEDEDGDREYAIDYFNELLEQ